MKVTVTITPIKTQPDDRPFWLVDVDSGESSTGSVAASYDEAIAYAQRVMKIHFDARLEEEANDV